MAKGIQNRQWYLLVSHIRWIQSHIQERTKGENLTQILEFSPGYLAIPALGHALRSIDSLFMTVMLVRKLLTRPTQQIELQPRVTAPLNVVQTHSLGVNINSSFGQATVKPSTMPFTNSSFVWPGASATSYRRSMLLVTLRISMKASCLPTQLYGPVEAM